MTGAWRSLGLLTARWSSTPSTAAPHSSWQTLRVSPLRDACACRDGHSRQYRTAAQSDFEPATPTMRARCGHTNTHMRLLCSCCCCTCDGTTHSCPPADSNAPTWWNNLDGQVNLRDAVNRSISLRSPQKEYRWVGVGGQGGGGGRRRGAYRQARHEGRDSYHRAGLCIHQQQPKPSTLNRQQSCSRGMWAVTTNS